MKYIVACILLTLSFGIAFSQEKHFVFIQSENRLPFYVSLSGKNYSSTASGYIIIPQVKEGNYNFAIGFANDQFPEQAFAYNIGKDVGLLFKNFGDKGWGLFNLQSMTLTMATEVKNADVAFTKPTVEEDKPISFDVKKEVVLPPIIQVSPNNPDSNLVKIQANGSNGSAGSEDIKISSEVQVLKPTIDVTAKETGAKEPNVGTKANIRKIAERSEDGGVSITYTDRNGTQSDTIDIVIPVKGGDEKNSEPLVTSEKKEIAHLGLKEKTDTTDVQSQNSSKKSSASEAEFLTGQKEMPTDAETTKASVVSTEARTDCKSTALEDDYSKLRRKMSRETTDDDMMKEAIKVFKIKCFSTNQIKALSTLFLSDQARYNFFESAFQYVADPEQFADLSKEFIDVSFATRFKAMITK